MELTRKNIEQIELFAWHCIKELGLKGKITVVLSHKPTGLPTAGFFDPENQRIMVAVHNRAMADVFRTIAHELVHRMQQQTGIIFPSDEENLRPYESQANDMGGRLVRVFGRAHPEIYNDLNPTLLSEVMFPNINKLKSI
jgi:hypothetical protein